MVSHRKGKTLEEEYGEEKAKEIRKKLRNSHKGYIMPKLQKQKIAMTSIFQKGIKPWNYIDGKWNKRFNPKKKKTLISHIVWCGENKVYKIPFSKEKKGCVIHHINQDPSDNRIENLQLMTRDFHVRLHSKFLKENILEGAI